MKPIIALLAVMLLPLAAYGEDTYSLKRVYKAGEVDRYKMDVNLQGSALQVELSLVVKETTKSVKEDGMATVERTIESGKMKFGGQEQPFPQTGQTTTVTIDTKTGKAVGANTNGGGPFERLTGLTSNLGIPDRPVKAGEEIKFESPSNDGKDKVTGTLKVVGIEPKSADVSVDTVKLVASVNLPSPEAGEKLKVDATAYIEPGTGKQLKLDGTVTGKLPMLGDSKIKITRVRMAPDAKP